MRDHAHRANGPLPLRNEVDPTDDTDHKAKAPIGFAITVIAALHVLCCGFLMPLLTGLSVAAILQSWPVIGITLALLANLAMVWRVRKKRRPVRKQT